MKPCSKCHIAQPLDHFPVKRSLASGHSAICKDCVQIYQVQYRRMRGMKPYPEFLQRIWGNIKQCDHGDLCLYCCWPWQKGYAGNGYPKIGIRVNKKLCTMAVPRIVYELWNARPLLPGYDACHHCDFRPCCNPLHLFSGTNGHNNRDAMRKGRNIKGEQVYGAKLEADTVLLIRRLAAQDMSGAQISRELGYPRGIVYRVLRRETWKHI